MAQSFSLDDLIAAVAGAVSSAQERVDQSQVAAIRSYFDEDGRPLCIDIKLPSMRSGAAPDEIERLSVPRLALAPVSLLQISEVNIEFDVELGELTAPPLPPLVPSLPPTSAPAVVQPPGAPVTAPTLGVTEPPAPLPDWAGPPRSQIAVGLQSSAPATSNMAKVRLKVEGQPPTEGMARLIAKLNQRI